MLSTNKPKSLYNGHRLIESCDSLAINQLYDGDRGIPGAAAPHVNPFSAHEYLILRNGSFSALAVYNKATDTIHKIDVPELYGIKPRNVEQRFAAHALTNDAVPLVTLLGKAGTGKTLLALAAALEKRSSYRQIILCRPIVALSNKDMGHLPGDAKEKINPYMAPLFDNLGVIRYEVGVRSKESQTITTMIEEEKLVIEPLAYIRGRSFVKRFVIVDEAQNLTPHEIKTIVTRAGTGTKFVFTGDVEQIDHPRLNKHDNGLTYLTKRLHDQELYAHVKLTKGERSPLADLACELL